MERDAIEFEAIKEMLKDYCLSENAKEMAKDLSPMASLDAIREVQEEMNEAVAVLGAGGQPPLNSQKTMRQSLEQIRRGMVLSPIQLHESAVFLKDMEKLSQFLRVKEELAPRLHLYGGSIELLTDIKEDINSCISHDMVLDQASPDLSKVRKRIAFVEEKIKDKLEKVLRNPAYRDLIQDSLIAQRGGRYVIPVKSAYKKQLEGQVHDRSASGSTVFIEPEEVRRLHDELSLLKMDEEKICYKIQSELTNDLAAKERQLVMHLEIMTHCDFLFARARLSRNMDAKAPHMTEAVALSLVEARHPLLGKAAVPLTLELGVRNRGLVITGPNTGGKTVAMKTVGLLCHMAHCGLHIPAHEDTVIGQIREILADIGDGQSISQNLSTFSSHMTNIAEIIDRAGKQTLVLLDEVGSGTDPREGMGIAVAILENLYEKGALIIASTHYGEIKTFGETHSGFVNGSMGFDLESLKPLYQLTVGVAGESNGILIAKRLGMPMSIIERALSLSHTEMRQVETPLKINKIEESLNLTHLRTVPKRLNLEEKVIEEVKKRPYEVGDVVKVPAMNLQGMITETVNHKGEVEIAVRDKRIKVMEKRIQLYIQKEELYPENYDMDVVLKSKDYRKKNKLISKGKGKGLKIEY